MPTTEMSRLPVSAMYRRVFPYAVMTRRRGEGSGIYEMFSDEITAELFYDLMRECASDLGLIETALFKFDAGEWFKVAGMTVTYTSIV